MDRIESPQNPLVKKVVRLRASSRSRRALGSFLVDGWREVQRAVEAGHQVEAIFLDSQAPRDRTSKHQAEAQEKLMALIETHDLKIRDVSQRVLEKLSYGNSTRGVVGQFKRPILDLDSVDPQTAHLLVLDRIEKPGNIGAILRSADAAGFGGVVLCECGDPFSENSIRNSSGAVFFMPIAETDRETAESWLGEQSRQLYSARVESSKCVSEIEFPMFSGLILGNEADGLGTRWSSNDIQPVRLPMRGRVDSLNVSAAATVLMFRMTECQNR
ncbi:MAG: RNA methyltransferase [Planctomycetota bacterium]